MAIGENMTDTQAKRLRDTLNRHEGFELEVYLDSEGNPTVGRGHLVLPEDNLKVGDTITEEQAEAFYEKDIDNARQVAENFVPNVWGDLSQQRQNVLTNMSFNLGGPRLNKFEGLKGALQVGDYNLASDEMMDSIWSGQVGRRADNLAYRMENDKWSSGVPWYKNAWWFAGDQFDKLKNWGN